MNVQAAMSAQTQYAVGAFGRDAGVVAVVQHGVCLPPVEACCREDRDDDRGASESPRQRSPRTGDDQDRDGEDAEEHRARTTDRRTARAAARPRRRRPGRRLTAAIASSASPHAATAVNSASPLTPIHTAVGARTIHGMARRARRDRAERLQGHQDRDDGGAADRDDHDADPERVGDAEAVEQHEEQQRAGRVPGDVGVPVVRRVHRDVVDERPHHRADRVDPLRVVDVLAWAFEDARESVGPLRHRQRHGPDPRAGERVRQECAPRRRGRRVGEARPTGARPIAIAGRVSRPKRGSQSACSGGQCTRTSSSVQRGTAIAAATRSSPAVADATAARAEDRVAWTRWSA